MGENPTGATILMKKLKKNQIAVRIEIKKSSRFGAGVIEETSEICFVGTATQIKNALKYISLLNEEDKSIIKFNIAVKMSDWQFAVVYDHILNTCSIGLIKEYGKECINSEIDAFWNKHLWMNYLSHGGEQEVKVSELPNPKFSKHNIAGWSSKNNEGIVGLIPKDMLINPNDILVFACPIEKHGFKP